MGAKRKSAYVCCDCGAEYAQWQGQCQSCEAWNTLTRVTLGPVKSAASAKYPRAAGLGKEGAGERTTSEDGKAAPILSEVDLREESARFSTGMAEFDRVLGGGLVTGSVVLIGGNPGAGKSTLLLQIMCRLSQSMAALYVSGEESSRQVGLRARRLGLPMDRLRILTETNIEDVLNAAGELQPRLMVVDSIQVMHSADTASAPGSVSQVRECAAYLIHYAKRTNTVLLLVGHVTKEGNLAGPKVLEHLVDCFMMLEGEPGGRFRTLRGQKNRFGAVHELGVFAMMENGLKEVKNPSAIFLARGEDISPGSVVVALWEGARPLLVEIQALVDGNQYGNPRRVSVGLDHNRVAMLLAVLHRHGGVFTADQDVFVNVAGGVRVAETSADLALLLAIASSFRDQTLGGELVVFGEVGLTGEIRPVPGGQERLQEAAKHGFTRAIIPKANRPRQSIKGLEIIAVSKLSQALAAL